MAVIAGRYLPPAAAHAVNVVPYTVGGVSVPVDVTLAANLVAGGGVIDPTGTLDSTLGIQIAIQTVLNVQLQLGKGFTTALTGRNDGRMLFFPAGTYLVSDTLSFQSADGRYGSGVVLQGQHRDLTIFKLAPNSSGFGAGQAKPVWQTCSIWASGISNPGDGGKGNNGFANHVRDLTIDTGLNNPGAVGLDYLSNNLGAVRNVLITSSDTVNPPRAGIALWKSYPGPCLISNTTVNGFQVGVDFGDGLGGASGGTFQYSVVFEHCSLSGQTVCGMRLYENMAVIRDLKSNNKVPAILFNHNNGQVAIVESSLSGGANPAPAAVTTHAYNAGVSNGVAIDNTAGGILWMRDVFTAGYTYVVANVDRLTTPPAPTLYSPQEIGPKDEFCTPGSTYHLWQGRTESLRMTFEEPPSWEDTDSSTWAVTTDISTWPSVPVVATTLAADTVAAATTISTNGSIPSGSAINVGGEIHFTSGVSGGGPFTITVNAMLGIVPSGSAVTQAACTLDSTIVLAATYDTANGIALQACLNSGAATICFGTGDVSGQCHNNTIGQGAANYSATAGSGFTVLPPNSAPFTIPATVKRITGVPGTMYLHNAYSQTTPVFTLLGGTDDALWVDMMNFGAGDNATWFDHSSPRPLVLRDVNLGYGSGSTTNGVGLAIRNGAGDVFMDDVTPYGVVQEVNTRVYARQVNQESVWGLTPNGKWWMQGGTAVVLGYKTERFGPLLFLTSGSRMELIGGFIFPINGFPTSQQYPIFSTADSDLALLGMTVLNYASTPVLLTRTVTDLATTSGSNIVTSATANFVSGNDAGKTSIVATGIPVGVGIIGVTNTTTATIGYVGIGQSTGTAVNATASNTGLTATIATIPYVPAIWVADIRAGVERDLYTGAAGGIANHAATTGFQQRAGVGGSAVAFVTRSRE